jgi:RimJ/RimL family protein N-acetyltransferase
MRVTLRPFTADLLGVVQPWFEHPEVQRWLGGPDWPAREFRTDPGIGEMFRGRRVLRTHSWLACDPDGGAVAQIGGDVYDRWISDRVEPGPAMGFAYVVDPQRWGRGYGTATLLAMMDAPEMADVRVFAAGIEPGNVASVRCALAAGLTPDTTTPDEEGIVHYLRRRRPAR